MSSNLFSPIQVGNCHLRNRIVFAPLTRCRNVQNVASDLQVTHYAQRAQDAGTLLISEATMVSEKSGGYLGHENLPGIWSSEQIAAWKKVTEDVHKAQSFFFLQLWDLGRASDPETIKKLGYDRVSASDHYTEDGKNFVRGLTAPEIKERVEIYVQAAENAIEAGADGVEIHAANGYLPDQFLRWNTNTRTDEYGGSAEKRARFVFEIVSAVVEKVGQKKTGIRLSPWTRFGDMAVDEHLSREQYEYVVTQLQARFPDLAYIHVIEGRTDGHQDLEVPSWMNNDWIQDIWKGPIIRAGGYTPESAVKEAQTNDRTLVAFGRMFTSNPDLVDRIRTGKALTKYDRSTFYTQTGEGYVDWKNAE
ncbi:NADPH dehydrogenase 1 [Yarrowia sp. B02]|nr:NADPH dehydrogenase 1 [Yarrowia sp. B02]